MSEPSSISAPIIESLYCEALALADEVRTSFSTSNQLHVSSNDEDLARIALSCEGLRTTTRMMHAIAWLLNQRAYHLGELTEFQLRRHGKLAHDVRGPDPDNLRRLAPEIRELIAETDRFYERLLRLDRDWRQTAPQQTSSVEEMRQRLIRNMR